MWSALGKIGKIDGRVQFFWITNHCVQLSRFFYPVDQGRGPLPDNSFTHVEFPVIFPSYLSGPVDLGSATASSFFLPWQGLRSAQRAVNVVGVGTILDFRL